jgi:ribonuclease HI
MEMMAALKALSFIADCKEPVDFYTDSTYLIRGITQWIWGWRRRDWKTAEGQDVSNRDIWEELSDLVQARGTAGAIDWKYSRGHTGIPGNERCDEIAVAFSRREPIRLFAGPLSSYEVDLLRLPTDTALPEMKSPSEKKAAFSYLSNIGGIVYRHKDWPSCERRVKGKSGAKFKKSTSAEDEIAILKAWGLDSSTPIKE